MHNHCTIAAFYFIIGKISKEKAISIENERDEITLIPKAICLCGISWSTCSALNVRSGILLEDKSIRRSAGDKDFKVTCPECIAFFKKAGL